MTLMIKSFLVMIAVTQSASMAFEKCGRYQSNFSPCMDNLLEKVITTFAKGDEDLRIQSVDPLLVEAVSFATKKNGLNLIQHYTNIKINGLTKNVKFSKTTVDFDKLIIHATSLSPLVNFHADFDVGGKVTLITVQGHGKTNVTLENFVMKSTFTGKIFRRNNEEYLRIVKTNLSFDADNIVLDVGNLFKDSLMQIPMDYIVQNKPGVVLLQLQESFEKAFAPIIMNIINDALMLVPLNEIFNEM